MNNVRLLSVKRVPFSVISSLQSVHCDFCSSSNIGSRVVSMAVRPPRQIFAPRIRLIQTLAVLLFSILMVNICYADIIYADADGDGYQDEITVGNQVISIFHPHSGTYSTYAMGSSPYTFYGTVDTDGVQGSEIVLQQDTYIVIISDARATRVQYSVGSNAVISSTGQTDGRAGLEIVGFNNAGLFVVADASRRLSQYGLQPDQPIVNPYLVTTFFRIADVNGVGGEEIVLVRGDNRIVIVDDTAHYVTVRDLSVVNPPGWLTTLSPYDIADLDGIPGGEIVVGRNDHSIVVVHGVGSVSLKIYPMPTTFSFAGIADTNGDGFADIVIARSDYVISIVSDRTGQVRNYTVGQPFSILDIGNYSAGDGAEICYTTPTNPAKKYALVDSASGTDFVSQCNAANLPPKASADAPAAATSGDVVFLDASRSRDPDGRIVRYSWIQTSGPPVLLSGISLVKPNFVAPSVSAPTGLAFTVTVEDDDGAIAVAETTVTINSGLNVIPPPGIDLSIILPIIEMLLEE